MTNLDAPQVTLQPVSVTRKMAASLPGLRDLAAAKGLKIHHLGAGYPHPEVTDPRGFLQQQQAYFAKLEQAEGRNDLSLVPEHLRESFSYTDTMGPVSTREAFASVYGNDLGISLDIAALLPTVGASGGISLLCSLFERAGVPLAYITDAPTYAGFVARASLSSQAALFSVEMDAQGADPERLRAQIRAARAQGRFVPFYYTVPDGHNPAGFSFSQARREALLAVCQEEGVLIVEDAPYLYISYADADQRPQPFVALAPEQTVHLFTGSKIGFPGPRVGFLYSQAKIKISGDQEVALTTLALTEASADILFQNPGALRGFEALLHDSDLKLRESLWPVAEEKLAVYRENRQILLDGLQAELGAYPELFQWTIPEAGFFSVFTFLGGRVRTDDAFIAKLVSDYGVVVIPMYDFYPQDARQRNPDIGFDELRLSFCFTESQGEQRCLDMREAVAAFCVAAKRESGLADAG